MKHDFEQLGDQRFQEFSQSLLLYDYPNLSCLPINMPDGGRDAIVRRRVPGEAGEFLIFQVKYVESPTTLDDATKWARDTLDGERRKIDRLIARGATRYVLVTNVPATSHLDGGSHDKVQAVLDELPIPSQCLWRRDLDRRLEKTPDLKWAYPDLMTGLDLVRILAERSDSEGTQRRSLAIKAFLAKQYSMDVQVHFKQVDLHNDLVDVFVDVPVNLSRTQESLRSPVMRRIRRIVGTPRFEHQFLEHPTGVGAATLLLDREEQDRGSKLVVEGAPGQGKSTMVQYVCQVHRMRLLEMKDDLARLPEAHRAGPLRVPFKVDLREFAQWLNGVSPFSPESPAVSADVRSLEGFLAALVRSKSGGAVFDVADLQTLFATTPTLVALDGLDEVADVGSRSTMVGAIVEAVERLSAVGGPFQVVVTSRPASFTAAGRFPAPAFEYVRLGDLTRELVGDYRAKWTAALEIADDQSQEIEVTLDEKLMLPHFRELARNPMQLAILLGLIHRKGPALPDRRTALYTSYMELFLDREASKSLAVRDHRELLLLLHGHLAWLMHAEAEASPRTGGRITPAALTNIVEDFLESRGHPRDLFEDLFGRVIERFGALNSRLEGTLEFEVQPLREYFAALYLYETAPYAPAGEVVCGTQPERLDAMLRRPLWLNVVRFFAGFYSVGELPSLRDRLEALAEDPAFGLTSKPRVVAMHLLADRTFSQDLRSTKKVVAVAAKGFGTRHAFSLGEEHNGLGGGSPAVLPPDGGAPNLVERMLSQVAESNPSPSRIHPVAQAIDMNSSDGSVVAYWLTQTADREGVALDRWFEFGDALGVFESLSRTQVAELVAEMGWTYPRVTALLRCGVVAPFDDDRAAADVATSCVLDDEFAWFPDFPGGHPLYLLAQILDANFRVLARETDRFPMPYDLQWPVGPWPEHFTSIMRFGDVYRELVSDDEVRWTRQLAPWRELVEAGRTLMGDGPAIRRLSIIASCVRDRRDRGGGAGDLFDDSVALCSRTRFARYRGARPDWWASRLAEAKDDAERVGLVVALMALWGTAATLDANADAFVEYVDALDDEQYANVALAVHQAQIFIDHTGDDGPSVNVLGLDAPAFRSARVLTLIAGRLDDERASALFSHQAIALAQSDPLVVHTMVRLESADLERDEGSWDRLLAILRNVEAAGLQNHPILNNQAAFRSMPLQAAATVLAAPADYPIGVVAIAERVQENVAVDSAPPVLHVAEEAGWFAND